MAILARLLCFIAATGLAAALPSSEDSTPPSTPTSTPWHTSAVPVGEIIYRCTQPGTVALTFDDGPYQYTDQILDILDAGGVKGTFFVNGQNMASIYDYQSTVQRMVNSGHQVASHTWSHPFLSSLSEERITDEMQHLDTALGSIIGKSPTYMRAPYFDSPPRVVQQLGEMGYHIIQCDVDTKDYAHQEEELIWESVRMFREGMDAGGSLVLAHDIHPWTARVLAQEMVNYVNERGLRGVTVGECLGDAPGNWYR
ncbi:hypothetical protein H2201_008030 [Coniosporium apollinis]|uniref:NodB homology domain-containing protein n=2 Tax=Coniosporium TaxID=2810619 RepID=A0ABQ9NI05_9PEZI|nr:hypothetical protein H2199_004154 [Cladosporium sp. JES 115]KAJ9657817.1 hypothetical protein H2201_008030 [Coniosporium apollinis]